MYLGGSVVKPRRNMVYLTVRVAPEYRRKLKELVKRGIFCTETDAVRTALRMLFDKYGV